MKVWTGLMTVTAAAVMATGAAAQDTSDRPGRSLAVSVGESSTVGVWFSVSPRVDLGLQIGGQRLELSPEGGDDDDSVDSWQVSFEPAVKLFATADGAFLPYTYLGAFARYAEGSQDGEFEDITAIEREYGAAVGLGLDWFPARRISVGAHAGLEGGLLNVDVPGLGVDGTFFRTFTSGVRVQLYF